jgi:glycosyltransferase involved in cell wall biosynthesis
VINCPPKHILILGTHSCNYGGIQHVAEYVNKLVSENDEFSTTTIIYQPTQRLSFYREVRAALRNADVVVSMHLSLQIALLGTSVPSVQFIHGIELEHHPNQLTRFLLSKAEILFCSTNFVRDSVVQLMNGSVSVMQALYPSPLFCRDFEPNNNSQKNGILLVSRLTQSDRYKGVLDVIEIYASESSEDLPDLNIVGDGDDRDFLESRVNENSLQDKIRFTGLLSNEELKNAFKSAGGFVLLSTNEGQGLVYVEALSYGLPVLALKDTVAEELIEHGKSGFLADKNDRDCIKDYLREMVKKKEMRVQARKRFEALRITEKFNQKLIYTLNRCAE